MKKKKIGVKFDKVNGRIYCYLTYDQRNTRFRYKRTATGYYFDDPNEENSDIDELKQEIPLMEEKIRFLAEFIPDFKINYAPVLLSLLRQPVFDATATNMEKELGSVFTYNHFKGLKLIANETFILNPYINEYIRIPFVDLDDPDKLIFDYIKDFPPDIKDCFFVYIAILTFDNKFNSSLYDWLKDFESTYLKFENHMEKESVSLNRFFIRRFGEHNVVDNDNLKRIVIRFIEDSNKRLLDQYS